MPHTALRRDEARTGSAGHLAELSRRARGESVEFPHFLANHLPMILVALDRLGASAERLAAYAETYRRVNGLVPIEVPSVGRIDRANWRDHLGDRAYEADYRAFFAAEVARLGPRAAQQEYLPALAPGVAASATHALMRLAYAALTESAEEVGVALGYWATTFLPLGLDHPPAEPVLEPIAILLRLRQQLTAPPTPPESDLLWHWMRAVSALPAFAGVRGALVQGPDTLEKMRRASLALMATTMTFEALHALTGCHWLRLISPYCPAMPAVLSAFWTAIAAVYPKIGMPLPLDAEALEVMRRMPHVPDWPEIAAIAVERDDEHDVSLSFSAREEWRATGDRLYQVIAARRLGLV